MGQDVSSRGIGINGLASFVLRFAVKHCAITTRSWGGGRGEGVKKINFI